MKKVLANSMPLFFALVIGLIIFFGYYSANFVPNIKKSVAETVAFAPTTIASEESVFSINKSNWEHGYLTATSENYKVLFLTDTHFTGSRLYKGRDQKMMSAITRMVNDTNPDFIIITGDLIYANRAFCFTGDNLGMMKRFASFIESLKIPWTMTFGNHETGVTMKNSQKELSDYLLSLPYCMYDSASIEDSYGNHFIPILNQDNTIRCVNFMFNASKKNQPINSKQISWYENTINHYSSLNGKTFLSMAYYHIPQQEFSDAWRHCTSGDTSTEYYFGAANEPFQKISCPDNSLGLFEKIKELGSTKAIFAGHNHANDFSVSYQGIRLTFGRPLDYVAYDRIRMRKTKRGGTLVEIASDSSFSITQLTC